MVESLQHKVIVVTGAAGGIGLASARHFAEQGAAIVFTDVAQASVEEAAEEARQGGARTLAIAADLTVEAEVATLFDEVADQFDRIDGLLCCAGIGEPQPILDTDAAAFGQVMAVNVLASFLCCKHAFRQMKGSGKGSLVLVASRLAQAAYPDMVPYVASKGAVVSMVRALAVDLSPHGIRVNAVSPGATETPMLQQEIEQSADPAATRRGFERQTLLGGIATPQDIAAAAGFLLSDASSFVTGSTLTVDGGCLARIFEGSADEER